MAVDSNVSRRDIRDMAQPFEEFLIHLVEQNDSGSLPLIGTYLDQHLAATGNAATERQRLAVELRDRAPDTELKQTILKKILLLD
jgi:hypothetical protein